MDTGKTKKEPFYQELDRRLLDKGSVLQLIDRDLLKFIALVLMTLGHWSWDIYKYFIPSKPLLRFFVAAEYFAPPVFFFFIAEGFHYTRSRTRYALRLLILAVITQAPNSLTSPGGFTLRTLFLQWSVLMTLFLGLAALIVVHSEWRLTLRLLTVAALMGLSWLLNCEGKVSGIMIILLFDLLRDKPLERLAGYMILMLAVISVTVGGLPDTDVFLRFLLPVWSAGAVITFFYNGKKGHFPLFSKYFFYVWYPLHLLVQWLFRITMA